MGRSGGKVVTWSGKRLPSVKQFMNHRLTHTLNPHCEFEWQKMKYIPPETWTAVDFLTKHEKIQYFSQEDVLQEFNLSSMTMKVCLNSNLILILFQKRVNWRWEWKDFCFFSALIGTLTRTSGKELEPRMKNIAEINITDRRKQTQYQILDSPSLGALFLRIWKRVGGKYNCLLPEKVWNRIRIDNNNRDFEERWEHWRRGNC